jgi:hypothetical protein
VTASAVAFSGHSPGEFCYSQALPLASFATPKFSAAPSSSSIQQLQRLNARRSSTSGSCNRGPRTHLLGLLVARYLDLGVLAPCALRLRRDPLYDGDPRRGLGPRRPGRGRGSGQLEPLGLGDGELGLGPRGQARFLAREHVAPAPVGHVTSEDAGDEAAGRALGPARPRR